MEFLAVTYPAGAGINPWKLVPLLSSVTYPAGVGINLKRNGNPNMPTHLLRRRGDKPMV